VPKVPEKSRINSSIFLNENARINSSIFLNENVWWIFLHTLKMYGRSLPKIFEYKIAKKILKIY
jgi:hypothetical protein